MYGYILKTLELSQKRVSIFLHDETEQFSSILVPLTLPREGVFRQVFSYYSFSSGLFFFSFLFKETGMLNKNTVSCQE